jgi:hypothetical protein
MKVHAANDPVRRNIFFTPVRWHSRNIGLHWRWKELQVAWMLRLAAGDYMGGEPPKEVHPVERLDTFLDNLGPGIRHIARRARRLAYRVTSLMHGDASARQWLRWRLGVVVGRLRGRSDHPAAPGLREDTQRVSSS